MAARQGGCAGGVWGWVCPSAVRDSGGGEAAGALDGCWVLSRGCRVHGHAAPGAGSGVVTGSAPAGQHGQAAAPHPPHPRCHHWYKAQSLKSPAAVGRWRILAERTQGVGGGRGAEQQREEAEAGLREGSGGGGRGSKEGMVPWAEPVFPPLLLAGEAGSKEPWPCTGPGCGAVTSRRAPPAPAPSGCGQAEARGCSPSRGRGHGDRAEGPLLSLPLQPALGGGRDRPGRASGAGGR